MYSLHSAPEIIIISKIIENFVTDLFIQYECPAYFTNSRENVFLNLCKTKIGKFRQPFESKLIPI